MPEYLIDRARLEALPTEEIQRILIEERNDYTPEAISIFQDILAARGIESRHGEAVGQKESSRTDILSSQEPSDLLIRTPHDGVVLLNQLLKGLLDGTVEPQVVEVGVQVVNSILRAMEQEFLTGSEE